MKGFVVYDNVYRINSSPTPIRGSPDESGLGSPKPLRNEWLVVKTMFSVYILYSSSSDKYYVGYTDDVVRRLNEHNFSDHSTYTSKHRPWILKTSVVISSERSVAMRFEKAIKKSKSRIVIEKIISTVTTVEQLSKLVRVPTRRD